MDFEQDETAEILGQSTVQEGGVQTKSSRNLHSNPIESVVEFKHPQARERTTKNLWAKLFPKFTQNREMVVSQSARVENLVENLAHGVEISGGS